ncbi:MAG: DUF6089 family protein [Bacteroidota bacterium]|nr:DUF6089 family protein [Bacteroidota bacterium]
MKKKLFILFVCFQSIIGFAQSNNHKDFYSHDVGLFLGGSYYIGDLNPRGHFALSQPAGGVFYRFNYSHRFAFRGGVNMGSVMADDSQSDNEDQLERNLNFKSRIYELYAKSEFNFMEYQIGHSKFFFSPYVFLGLDVFYFNPQGNVNNSWVNLKRLSTEGQKTSQNPDQKPYKLIQPAIPFGLGFKLNIAKSMGLGFEWGPRKTFTDYIDDVSNKYVDPALLAAEKGATAAQMSNRSEDPLTYANNTGKLRGNPNTKDWFFFYGVTLSIKLKQKPKECRGR